MELVKLKMKPIYKIFLSVIGFLILIILFLGGYYYFYNKIENDLADIEVNSSLSINYIDGKNINVENSERIKFSITNDGNNISYYNIGFSNIKGKAIYKLYTDNQVILEDKISSENKTITEYIAINANETIYYELEIINEKKSNFTATIEIKTKNNNNLIFSDKILKDNEIKEPITVVGKEIAVENEGLIKDTDDYGTTYYFRGNVLNNYVSFGNKIWRIVRINGDGTVRLVLDGETSIISNFYKENDTNYDYNNSVIKTFLNNWLQENLSEYAENIVNTKFCNDIVHDDANIYNSYTRIAVNKIPSFNCLGTNVDTNIGLLTVDEIVFAGGLLTIPNKNYYLYLNDLSWPAFTMSGGKGDSSGIYMFTLDKDGSLNNNTNSSLIRSVRPVINIIKKATANGSGTKDNPYTLNFN